MIINPPAPPTSFTLPVPAANLDSNGLEQLRVSEGQFHHLLDLSQLFAAAANIVIANLIQSLLLFLQKKQNLMQVYHINNHICIIHVIIIQVNFM